MVKQRAIGELADMWGRAYSLNNMPVPFFSYPWHRLWFETLGGGEEQFLLSVDDDIIAPFVRRGDTVEFSGGAEIADYLDIIGLNEKKQNAWQELIGYFQMNGVTNVHLRNVPENSPSVSFFSSNNDAQITPEDTTPKLMLPPSWDAYTASLEPKYRHELERKMRKFEREHPEATIRHSNDPARDIPTLFALMEMDAAKRNFLTEPMKEFFKSMANVFAKETSLLLLYIEDKPKAATISFISGFSYYLYNSGFDKVCCKNSGFYLKAKTIQYAIEQKVNEYNFLQGNERYKYELGGVDFVVNTIDYRIPIDR